MLIADFHIHSKYSRACSRDLTLANIATASERKGINLVGTGDFTHPAWRQAIDEELTEIFPGIFVVSGSAAATRFILTTELSCIYSQAGQTRRLHLLIFAPHRAAVRALVVELEKRGCNLRSDGRPILGLSAKDLLQIILEIDPEMMMVPAHAWTPWFSVFGSKSGFNSLTECFAELTPHIRAIETGLSSDPPMNWHWSALDELTLISNSDAHSLDKLGREANVLQLDPTENYSYATIVAAIKNKRGGVWHSTIEFFPAEGKYHADGHAACKFFCDPAETKKLNGFCPRCGKKLTVGVNFRVQELADRVEINSEVIHKQPTFQHIIPLRELIAYTEKFGVGSKKVAALYEQLLRQVGNEFYILLQAEIGLIAANSHPAIAAAVAAMRAEKVELRPGYDGLFGEIKVLSAPQKKQATLW